MPLPFIAQFLIQTAIGIGLSFVASKLQKKPELPSQDTRQEVRETGGAILDIEYGEATPRQVAIGKCAVRGLACYDNSFGEANKTLQRVLKLSDFYTSGLQRVAINGEWVTLGTYDATRGYPVTSGEFAGLIWVKYLDGRQTAADAYLTGNDNPDGRWTANHIGIGISHAILTLEYDAEKLTSIPEILIEFLGAPLYDPRKDGSIGGTGAHRWNNVATWEYSANPIIADYCYRRGFYTGTFGSGHDVFMGMGVSESELDFARYSVAADICDQTVSGEARYVVSLMLDANKQHGDNIEDLMLSCAGMVVEAVTGSYPILGASQTPVATLTDDDLIVGEPIEFRRYRPMNEVVNTVFGTYSEPSFAYAATGYAAQTTAGAVSLDRRTLDFQLNLAMVPSKRQAEQLASIYFSENRYEVRKTVTVRERWQVLEVGDWITWTNDTDGAGSRSYQIVGMTIASYGEDAPRAVTLSLQERHADIYAGIGPVTPPTPAPRNALPVYLQEVQGFEVTAIYVGDGAVYPGIRAAWAPVTDPTVSGILVEWRPTGDDTRRVSKLVNRNATVAILQEGVVASTEYQVRTTLVPDPFRVTTPSAWSTVTTLALGTFVGPDQIIPDTINASHIEAGAIIEEKLANAAVSERAMQDAAASYRTMAADMIETLELYRADIYGIRRSDLTGSGIPSSSVPGVPARPKGTRSPISTTESIIDALYQIRNRRQIEAKFGNAIASLAEEETVQVAIDSAIAALSQTLQAQIGSNTAAIESEAVARSTGDDALAAQILELSATIPDEEITTAAFLQEIATRASADEALSSRIVEQTSVLGITEAIIGTLEARASLKREQTARSTADYAISTLIDALRAEVETNNATITASLETEQTARASADEALATDLAALTATVTDTDAVLAATLASERTARATADTALAQDITALTATVESNNTTLTAAIATEQSARSDADDALAADITSLTSTVEGNNTTLTAAIASEASTRATADTSLASDITALSTTVDDNSAAILAETTARTNADTALASDITALSVLVDDNAAAIVSEASARASADGVLTTSVTALTSELTTARGVSPNLGARLDGIDTTVATKAASSALSALDTRVTTAEGTITTQGSAITALQSDLADAETDIFGNATAIDGLDTRVTAAEGTITSQGTSLTSVQAEISTARGGEAALGDRLDLIDADLLLKASASALSSLDARVTTAEGTITSQGGAITSVTAEVEGARGGEANLNARLGALDATVADKASSSAVTALDARVTQTETDITANSTAITQVEAKSNAGTATGLFKMDAVSAPTGVSARLGGFLRTTDGGSYLTDAAFFLDALDGGESRFVIAADRTVMSDSAGNIFSLFDATGAKINGDLLVAGSVQNGAIADGAVTVTKILDGQVNAVKIADGAITANKVAAGAITADKIAAGSITADRIAAGTITATQIVAAGITALYAAAWSGAVTTTSSSYSLVGTPIYIDVPSGAGVMITAVVNGGPISLSSWFGTIAINGSPIIIPTYIVPNQVHTGSSGSIFPYDWKIGNCTMTAVVYPPPGTHAFYVMHGSTTGGAVRTESVYINALLVRR